MFSECACGFAAYQYLIVRVCASGVALRWNCGDVDRYSGKTLGNCINNSNNI